MKRPKYLTTETIKEGETEFPAFTELQVFWNDFYVPSHLMEMLETARRQNYTKEKMYMCLIGRTWIVLKESNIVERY